MLNKQNNFSAMDDLKRFKVLVDAELKNYFDEKVSEAKKISPITEELAEQIADLTLRGGKRIRAALLYYSYLGHGGRNKSEALKAAMSTELSETYMLIHDDIMDQDDFRRGGETIHVKYSEKYAAQLGNDKKEIFGLGAALVAGDMACAMANQILADRKFKPSYVQSAMQLSNKIYLKEGYGQLIDMFSSIRKDIGKKDIIQTHELKTVPYTFDGPIKIGALLAGANERELKNIEGYSIPLGTAFQLQDDILGLFGTQEKLGKPVASDFEEGKRTLLMLDALDHCSVDDKKYILASLGNKEFDLERIKSIIVNSGALEKSKKACRDLVDEAVRAVKLIKINNMSKDFFLGIADYMVNREF